MKKSFAIATFLGVAGVGSVGVHALSNISLHGSDTLFNVTTDLLTGSVNFSGVAQCPGAVGLTYLGGGSGTGETGMVNGAQTVAPMSRFLQGSSAVCAAAADAGNNAQGLVFALDGVAVLTSAANGGSVACNSNGGVNNNVGAIAADGGVVAACQVTDPTPGLASNTTVTLTGFGGGTYTFNSWKDVLKVLYAGKDNTGTVNCDSNIRQYLAANYGSLFETANCTTGCTQIQHIFRRDDSSGTSDIFSQLLGLTSPNNTTNKVCTTCSTQPYFLGVDSYCNAVHPASGSNDVAGASVYSGMLAAWQAIVPAAIVPPTGVIPDDYQGYDPIRRSCAGAGTSARVANEQVCDNDGKLGLLLTMPDTNQAGANQYGSGLSCNGKFIQVQSPLVVIYSARGAPSLVNETCPNGDDPSGGLCFVPTDANGNPNCVATANQNAAPITNHTPHNGVNPATADGRVFNRWVYNFTTGQTTNPTVATDNTNTGSAAVPATQRPIIGAYYRIHQSLTMTPGSTATCAKPDMTDQIGCLVNASPCSLGYAGRSADRQAGATALLVNAVPDAIQCVQGFAYPLSRKLYLDTLIGYGATGGVAGQEFALAQCENNSGTVGGINAVVSANGFVPLPDAGPNAFIPAYPSGTYNNGAPFAEDFNEQMLCGAASNNVAFTGNVGMPTIGTVCGNGVKESFEDCDNGASNVNGGAPGTCSQTCRIN